MDNNSNETTRKNQTQIETPYSIARTQMYNLLCEIKYIEEYVNIIKRRSVNIDLAFKILTTVLSAGSLAVWAYIQDYEIIWAGIITSSQVLSLVYDKCPFNKRITEATIMMGKLEDLYNDVHEEWMGIASRKFEAEDINKITAKYKSRLSNIQKEYFRDDNIPEDDKIKNKADAAVNKHFEINEWG